MGYIKELLRDFLIVKKYERFFTFDVTLTWHDDNIGDPLRSKRYDHKGRGKKRKVQQTFMAGKASHKDQLIGIGSKTFQGTNLSRRQRHPVISLIHAVETQEQNARTSAW